MKKLKIKATDGRKTVTVEAHEYNHRKRRNELQTRRVPDGTEIELIMFYQRNRDGVTMASIRLPGGSGPWHVEASQLVDL